MSVKKGRIVSPCRASPPCPKFAVEGERFCEEHLSEYKISREDRRSQKKQRDPFYGTAKWKRTSRRKRRKNPICEECCTKFTELVHHIKPVKQYPELAYEDSNLISLCHTCHNRIEGKIRKEKRTNL